MKVLAYGEVLFNVFSTKEESGGAPFNFAAHMARLGAVLKQKVPLTKGQA